MNDMVSKIDELIIYLIRVFNGTELTSESKKEKEKYGDYAEEDKIVRSQKFFILTKDLDDVLKEWFQGFKNEEELKKTLKFKLGALKKLSFSKGKEGFFLVKDLSNHNNVVFTKQRHNDYSHIIHSHLIKVFEERIGVKKVKDNKRITIRDKKVHVIVEALNLEIDFLRDDILPNDFILVLIRQSDKNIHLNIDNGSFHYLITKLNEFFYNLTMSNVARTNKICSYKGTIISVKNLLNSKSDNPKLKDSIDRVFKKFE